MAEKGRGISRAALAGIGLALLLLGFIAYQSTHLENYECDVCMVFEGREKCLTVKGETEMDTVQVARDNACSFITTGRAEGFRCSQSQAKSVQCRRL